MLIKSFYGNWTNQEIAEYLRTFNILVLFEVKDTGLVLKIYADMSEAKKEQLESRIMSMFGGQPLTNTVCDKINEFAGKWYSKVVLGKTFRVINKTRRSV